ncbi:MAG: PH domain-containing protein [Acidimicrobiales bacterium]|jgi:membrane protein YdbS with pleckstrin-like domain
MVNEPGEPDGGAQAQERWLGPSARLLAMRRAELAAIAVVVAGCLGFALGSEGSLAAGVIAVAIVCALGVLCEQVLQRRYRSWGYCERSADLLVRRGVMFRRLTVVPYGRMQLVDVTAGAIERTFGLQTVRLHTAAAATDARIPGLEPAEATRLRDRLALLGETQAAGI